MCRRFSVHINELFSPLIFYLMETLAAAEELKRSTKAEHQALEGKIVRLIKGTMSLADYHELLRFFYGFYQPVESGVLAHLDEKHLPDIKSRRKSSLLKADLQATGYDGNGLSTSTKLPAIDDIPTAFGALYVLEGSTIGGRYILDLLKQQVVLPEPDGIAFFFGYGHETMTYWEAFKSALNHHVKTRDAIFAATASAKQTFQAFSYWADINANYARKEKL